MQRAMRNRVLTKSYDKNSEFPAQRDVTINKQFLTHETFMHKSSQQGDEYKTDVPRVQLIN